MSSLSHSLKYISPISASTPSPLSISYCIGPSLPSPVSNSNLIFQAINQADMLHSTCSIVFNQGQPAPQRSEALIQRAPTPFGGRHLLALQSFLCECLPILVAKVGIYVVSHIEPFFNSLTYTIPFELSSKVKRNNIPILRYSPDFSCHTFKWNATARDKRKAVKRC